MTVNLSSHRSPSVSMPARKIAISRATSEFLDLSRWVAAFLVVFSHVRSIVLANYPDVPSHSNLLVKTVYFLAGFGHMSVVVFFVISGFLVGGRATLKAAEGRFSLLDYTIHRFARIYIVLIPALCIGLAFDWIGASVDNLGLYTNTSHFHWWMINYAISDRLGLYTLLGNMLLLQTIFVEPLGSNGTLWSLANEWWYYVAFGLGIAVFLYPNRITRALCCCGLVGLLWVLPANISIWFTLWLIGAGVALIEQSWKGWPAPIGAAVCLAIMVGERLLPPALDDVPTQEFLLDLLVALGFSLALLCAKRGRWAIGKLHPWLASFSYTTYLVHAPAMAMIVVAVHRRFSFGVGEQPNLPALAFMMGLIGVLYVYAWLFAALTEAKTEKLRLWLRQRVDRALVKPASPFIHR